MQDPKLLESTIPPCPAGGYVWAQKTYLQSILGLIAFWLRWSSATTLGAKMPRTFFRPRAFSPCARLDLGGIICGAVHSESTGAGRS